MFEGASGCMHHHSCIAIYTVAYAGRLEKFSSPPPPIFTLVMYVHEKSELTGGLELLSIGLVLTCLKSNLHVVGDSFIKYCHN